MSGDAFSNNSEMPLSELSGLRKKIHRVDSGDRPASNKMGALTMTVSKSARTGAPIRMKRNGGRAPL